MQMTPFKSPRRRRVLFDWWRKNNLIFKEDFDTPTGAAWTGYELYQNNSETPFNSHNLSYPYAPGNRGQEKCMKVVIGPDDWAIDSDNTGDKERAELIREPSQAEYDANREVWYAYSLFIPEDYDYNSDGSAPPGTIGELFQVMGQWHSNGQGGVPPLELFYRQSGAGQSSFVIGYGIPADTRQNGSVNIARGVWHDLVYHIRWSTTATGFCTPYLNGVSLGTFTGRNVAPAQGNLPHIFRLGIYRGHGDEPAQGQTNTFYIGRVRIGKGRPLVTP